MLEFDGVPFSVGDVRILDCQFGEKYYKQNKPLGKRLWLQGTRKLGCGAHIQTKSFVLYPEYAVVPTEHVSKWKLQCLRQEKLRKKFVRNIKSGQSSNILSRFQVKVRIVDIQ